ncbi:MAG: VOC family protein [Colwellia sp.]|jgi:Glyoxalase/Bleomycin resistance protein/Dioxygenase superfamily.
MDIRALGYFVAQTDNIEEWKDYAEQVLGMMTSATDDGGLYIKMDERPFRMLIVPGEEKRYLASGWELSGQTAFNDAKQTLIEKGIAFEEADEAFCQLRGAQEVLLLNDPAGNRHELYWGYISNCEPFISPQGVPAFVTGEMGLGHTVIPAPNFDETYQFLNEVMGFGLSDLLKFEAAPGAEPLRIYFLHCANARHHSLAICAFPVPSGCVHAMVEVENMTEVGRAQDRQQQHGIELSATLGQHLNDKVTSFYMKTPSGFDMEFGYGGMEIDWKSHSVFEFKRVSLWGHDFSVGEK